MRLPNRLPTYPTIQTGLVYELPATFIVYKSGATIKALNCSTGVVNYSGSYINDVVNSCIGAVTLGAKILIKSGLYSYDDAIDTALKQITIEGLVPGFNNTYTSNDVQLRASTTTAADYVIKSGTNAASTDGLILRNLCINGRQSTTLLGAVYWRNVNYSRIENCKFIDFYGTAPMAYGVNIEGDAGLGAYYNTIQNSGARRCMCGIRLGSLANGNSILSPMMTNVLVAGNPTIYGIWLNGCDTATILGGGDMEGMASTGAIALYITGKGANRAFGLRFEGNYGNIQIDAGAATGYNTFVGCSIASITGGGSAVIDNGQNKSNFYSCSGYATEKWGTSTGTDAQQTIAHGLGAAPTLVLLSDKELAAIPYQSAAADATNIYVLAALNQDYSWYVRV